MAFELKALSKEDVPRCVQIYFASFQNAHSLGCWPRVPAVQKWWEDMFYDEKDEAGAHFLKAVNQESGELAAFGKWVEPKVGVEVDTKLPRWPDDADGRLCDETFGEWARQHSSLMGTRGHWCKYCAELRSEVGFANGLSDLEIIATDPKYQGKGAGSMFLRYGCERADRDGMEAFLEASPEGVRLYEKMGFQEAGKTDTFIKNERVPGVWYRNIFMIRRPK